MAAPPLTIDPVEGLTTATMDSGIVAASLGAKILHEKDHPPVIYLPWDNALAGAFLPTAHKTRCPGKGEAAYFTVHGHENAAWTYYDPLSGVEDIAGHLAFSPDTAMIDTRPLPALAPEAADILTFWFETIPSEKHFEVDPQFDLAIASRFGALHAAAVAGELSAWEAHPKGALALLILIDQFSRNLHRNRPEAFAYDDQGRQIARGMLERGHDLALAPDRRAFAYLPFMHSEDMADQNLSVALYRDRLPGSTNMGYALGHRRDIHRHGRFPHRDKVLGRQG